MELIHEIFYAVVCVEIFLCVQDFTPDVSLKQTRTGVITGNILKIRNIPPVLVQAIKKLTKYNEYENLEVIKRSKEAQVTFDPDPEGDVQLNRTVLEPPVNVTTVQCYSSSPIFRVQYASTVNNNVVFAIKLAERNEYEGNSIGGDSCGGNDNQFRVIFNNLMFISDPVLVGGKFKLKATLNNNTENSTFSRMTYTFPAPFNLTGSSVSAVVGSDFTWTCHVTSDYPIIEWKKDGKDAGQAGVLPNIGCKTDNKSAPYLYECQETALTYTLTIPGSILTKELQGSTWRCKDYSSELKGSKFMKLDILVPVTSVTISPGGGGSTLNADENEMVNFKCTTNDANPSPTILWYIGSSDVTSQAGSNRTTLTLNVSKEYHQMTLRCEAGNSGNTENLNDSTTLNVRFPPANNEELQITGYTSSQVLYENSTTIIDISCTQPGGNPVVNMTFKCGSQTGTNRSTATEAIRGLSLTINRSLDGTQCVCTSTHINAYMRSKGVTFTVYYPPSAPNISISSPFPWKANESQSLTCNTTPGNPLATTYTWKEGETELSTTSQTYSINPLQSIDNGRQLSCQVNNDFTLHQNVVLTSDVTKLQVEYNPHVTLDQSSVEVIEGHSAVLRCSATGNPVPTVTWYRDSTPVTGSTISSSTYNVTNASRTLTGYYTCKANSSSTGSNILQPDQKNTHLRVFYPPTVQIYFHNTTENTGNHTIRCSAEGDPNNSKFVALQQRIGSVSVRNITSFSQFPPGNMSLNINMVSYQDMGTYTCLASNGIPDRSNQMVQSDSSYFNVITSAKFEMDQYTVRSDIDTEAVVKIPFYRNPPATESDVVWTSNTATSNGTVVSSANVSLSLNDTDVQQQFYGVDITLRGQSAIMNITSFQNYYEGNYTLIIRSNHADSAEVTVTLIRSGSPDTPSDFQLLSSKVTSVVLTWNKGSDGGHRQTFVVLYREKTTEVYDVKQIVDTTMNVTITYEMEHLKSDTSYEFILYSFNEKGNSTGNQALEERTLKEPSTSTQSSLNSGLVGGAAGGGAALLVIIAVLAVVLKRRRNKREDNDSKGILNNKEMSAGPSKRSDDDEDEGGLKENPLYGSSPGGANAVQGASAAPENLSQYAEVVKPKKKIPAKESQDPPPIYAEVDKSKKKGKGLMKLKKQSPPRVGEDPPPIYAEVDKSNKKNGKGDVYEVVDGFKEKETQFNDPANAQKNKEGGQRGYRNQDGLLYVDVKFDQPPPTGKPIIRGEERTGYAMIEFEKPPTYSTADDVQGAEGGE